MATVVCASKNRATSSLSSRLAPVKLISTSEPSLIVTLMRSVRRFRGPRLLQSSTFFSVSRCCHRCRSLSTTDALKLAKTLTFKRLQCVSQTHEDCQSFRSRNFTGPLCHTRFSVHASNRIGTSACSKRTEVCNISFQTDQT